jgi:hypothetical protein
MLAAIEFDEWPEAAHTHAHAARSTHPLGVFDPRECGAWIDTLRALRALPNRVRAPGTVRANEDRADTNEDDAS